MQTAKHVWDQLLAYDPVVFSTLDAIASQAVLAKLQSVVEEEARPIYETLKQEHADYISRERDKAARAFAARRSVIERIGLPQVRRYRLNLLAQEERHFFEQLENRAYLELYSHRHNESLKMAIPSTFEACRSKKVLCPLVFG